MNHNINMICRIADMSHAYTRTHSHTQGVVTHRLRTTDLKLGKYSIAEPHPLPESGSRETKEKREGMKGEGHKESP